MQKRTLTACLITVSALFVLGLVLVSLVDLIVEKTAVKQTLLSPGSPAYQQWVAPSVPMYLQFYFFNLTNPDEFLTGAKPVVEQMGPYTYREQRFKINISTNSLLNNITYKEVKRYFFEETLSVGLESDVLIGINLGYIALANTVKRFPPFFAKVLSIIMDITNYRLCVNHTVKEILWGYQDPMFHILEKFDIISSDEIGLYLNKNDTDDGFITIDSGANTGQILQYHGFPSLSCWTTSQANMINGSDGSLFHSLLQPHEHIDVFSSDICRSIRFSPVGQQHVEGIPVIKYLPLENTFESPLKNPGNEGFCLDKSDCLKDGMMDMSTCIPDAPMTVSLPHLTGADPSYQSAVLGLHPSDEFNTTFLIQPTLGAVLSASKMIQLNAVVKRNKDMKELVSVHDVFLPIVFLNESVRVDVPTAAKLRLFLVTGPLVAKVVGSVFIVLLFVAMVILSVMYYRVHRSTSILSDQEEDMLVPSVVA